MLLDLNILDITSTLSNSTDQESAPYSSHLGIVGDNGDNPVILDHKCKHFADPIGIPRKQLVLNITVTANAGVPITVLIHAF